MRIARSVADRRGGFMCPCPQAILFDAVGTLLFPHPTVAEVYFRAGQRFGSRRTRDQIELRFRRALKRHAAGSNAQGPWRNDTTSEADERRCWAAIVAEVFDDVADTGPLFEQLWHHFAQPEHWRLFDDAAEACERLANSGFRLAIASNFDSRLRRVCRGFELLADWPLFISSEIGVRKPSPEFFRRVAAALGLPGDRLLLVGDDVENDYRAARRAGWQALLIDRTSTTGAEQDDRLHDLRDLPQWVDSRC